MHPLVTVITPCFNHEKYLYDYFSGLMSQTYRNIELVIFDDGSTDTSWELICSYKGRLEKAFPRVICKRNENIGLIRELAELRKRITGDFVCILESDDYYKPTKIEENIKYFHSHPEAGVVHSDLDFIYEHRVEERHWTRRGKTIPTGYVFEDLLWENFVVTASFCCQTALFQKHVDLDKYYSRGYLTADYPVFLDLARQTKFGYIDKSLACYRVVENSISHPTSLEKIFEWRRAYFQTKLDYISEYGASEAVIRRANRQYNRHMYDYGYELFRKKEFFDAYYWLLRNEPKKFCSLSSLIMALAMCNRALWKMMRRLNNRRFAKNSLRQFYLNR